MPQESNTTLPLPGEATTEILSLLAEEVSVSRREVAGDLVRLSTSIRTREHLVDEELAREQVTIERVAIGRIVDAAPEIRVEGDVTIVPVVKEEVVIQRRLVLTEEVHMRRVRTTERHRETVTLREQVAEVTRIGAEHRDSITEIRSDSDMTMHSNISGTNK